MLLRNAMSVMRSYFSGLTETAWRAWSWWTGGPQCITRDLTPTSRIFLGFWANPLMTSCVAHRCLIIIVFVLIVQVAYHFIFHERHKIIKNNRFRLRGNFLTITSNKHNWSTAQKKQEPPYAQHLQAESQMPTQRSILEPLLFIPPSSPPNASKNWKK